MLFKRFESEGLSHYSYIVGDGTVAAVIDPRRDCDVYLDEASKNGLKITHIFETHRNEDYVTGSPELAAATGAEIFTADAQLNIRHGRPVKDGEEFMIGRLKIKAIHTPGHTPGHMSYLLHDTEGIPWILFSGDSLFAGDVGRTDFLGADMLEEMTGEMYDTIFERILPLGDHIILCPAHGPGSVCGAAISEREWTTIGIERMNNPRLQFSDREAFIMSGKMLERSPYFRKMEELNVEGPDILGGVPFVNSVSPGEFEKMICDGGVVLDTRSEVEYGSGHIPGAVYVPDFAISVYAGWWLSYDKPVLLVADADKIEDVTRRLVRIGYDNIAAVLGQGMLSWQKLGKPTASIKMPSPVETCEVFKSSQEVFVLDVRKPSEVEKGGTLPGAVNINLTELNSHTEEIPRDKEIYVFCGSGTRAMMGASVLERFGFERLSVTIGGIKGLKAVCPDLKW